MNIFDDLFHCFSQTSHPELLENYLKEKKENLKSTNRGRKTTVGNLPLSQEKYENVLVDLIIDGMLPMSIVSLDAFKRYTHGECLYYLRMYNQFQKKM